MNINGIKIDKKDFYIKEFCQRRIISDDSWCITNGKFYLGLTSKGKVKKTLIHKSAFFSKNIIELGILLSMAESDGKSCEGYYLKEMGVIRDENTRLTLQIHNKTIINQNKGKSKRCKFSKDTRKIVYKKSGGKCAICGCQLSIDDMNADNYITIDHIVPLDKGGKNELSNYQAACKCCNRVKSNIMPEVFSNNFQSVLFQIIIDNRQTQNQLMSYIFKAKIKQFKTEIVTQLATVATMLL